MVIGFLVALVLFAPLSYAITRGVTRHSQRSNSPVLGALLLFVGQLVGLSLLSFALLAAASLMGFSASLAADALVSTASSQAQPGVVTVLGGLFVAVWGFIGAMAGPACAFVSAKIMGIVALIAALTKIDGEQVLTWLPLFAAGAAVFTMWPFTAYLTFGL